MGKLILNCFPVEVSPPTLALPYVEYSTWEASTAGRKKDYPGFKTYRYKHLVPAEGGAPTSYVIRLLLLSGTRPPANMQCETCDIGKLPGLANTLIEQSLARHLKSCSMTIRRGAFETLALHRREDISSPLIHLYSGISFRARRPHQAEPYRFALTVQWEAVAHFAETLSNKHLRKISDGLAVLYTPQNKPLSELDPFQNRFVGRVKDIISPREAVVSCKDNVLRTIALPDLTLEASSEAIRRFEQQRGIKQRPSSIWSQVQQLSKVLTKENRRNASVLSDRLDAIRAILGGTSREQLVLALHSSYAEGKVSIGLSPQSVELAS